MLYRRPNPPVQLKEEWSALPVKDMQSPGMTWHRRHLSTISHLANPRLTSSIRSVQVDELTSPQLIESIFDIYFQFCHNQPYSLFHEGRLRDRLRSGSLPDYMIYAISAYALRFSQGSLFGDRTEQIMESYAVTAWLRLVIRWNSACDEPTDLPIIQTMLLLSIIDFSSKLSSLNLVYVLLSD
jgi:hypothetical protein